MFLYGAGGHAKVIVDICESLDLQVEGIFDDNESLKTFCNYPVGLYPGLFLTDKDRLIVTIGDNATRKKIVSGKTGVQFVNVIHSSVTLSANIQLGQGNMFLHGAIVQAGCVMGNHVILNTGCQVDHDCRIHDFVHIGPGVILSGSVEIGEGAFLGAGSIVIPGKRIGAWTTIGAGAVVITDIPDYAVAVGNPARIIKYTMP